METINGRMPHTVVKSRIMYRLSHIKFHSVIGRRRITIQPPPSGLVKFNRSLVFGVVAFYL
jgi:hypothetical protein